MFLQQMKDATPQANGQSDLRHLFAYRPDVTRIHARIDRPLRYFLAPSSLCAQSFVAVRAGHTLGGQFSPGAG